METRCKKTAYGNEFSYSTRRIMQAYPKYKEKLVIKVRKQGCLPTPANILVDI